MYELWNTKRNTQFDDTQSVTELIAQGHSTLSGTDNVALFHIVQEHMTKTKRKMFFSPIITVCYMCSIQIHINHNTTQIV